MAMQPTIDKNTCKVCGEKIGFFSRCEIADGYACVLCRFRYVEILGHKLIEFKNDDSDNIRKVLSSDEFAKKLEERSQQR